MEVQQPVHPLYFDWIFNIGRAEDLRFWTWITVVVRAMEEM
jgi:hypothetical protein